MEKYTKKIQPNIAYILLWVSILIFSPKISNANTYITAVNGNWNNQGCWANSFIPLFTINDTVIIKHHIVLPSNLTLLNGAYILIESTGGLCGHIEIELNTGATLIKYGILEIDVLNQSGGIVSLYPPGNTIFTQYGSLTGGSFNNTSNLSVGPWFECQMPEYQFLNGLNEHKKLSFNIYPNPILASINIDLAINVKSYDVFIYNLQGVLVFQNQYSGKQKQIEANSLVTGTYFLKITYDETIAIAKFSKL
jgi:hypothetical protein